MLKQFNKCPQKNAYTAVIIIPAYNEEDTLRYLVASLKRQKTSIPMYVIVVDNNSTDGTSKFCTSQNINVVGCKIQGIGPARNKGIEYLLINYDKELSKTVIVQLDADEELKSSSFISDVVTAFSKNEDAYVGIGKTIYPIESKDGEYNIHNGRQFKDYFNTVSFEKLFTQLHRQPSDYLVPSERYYSFIGGNTTYRASLFNNKSIRFSNNKGWEMTSFAVKFYQYHSSMNVMRIGKQIVLTSSRAYKHVPLATIRNLNYIPPYKSPESFSPVETLHRHIYSMDRELYDLDDHHHVHAIVHKETYGKRDDSTNSFKALPVINYSTQEKLENRVALIAID